MKKFFTSQRVLAAVLFLVAGITQALANEENIIWVKADVYPTGAGTVYTDWSTTGEKDFQSSSEFKRHTNGAISTAFIWAQPADGYQIAGYVRDNNGNGTFDNDTAVDRQIKVRADGLFTGVYDPTVYSGNSSTEAYDKAEEAMKNMTAPTDHVFAVFTQGAVARPAVGQETHGKIWASKLFSVAGDEISFTAYGDSESQEEAGVKYFKFDHWTNAAGETIGKERTLKITVGGMDVYYANFVETTVDDFKANEKDPHGNGGSGGEIDLGVESVKSNHATAKTLYDLQGRRVEKATKGMFIQNGKKLIIK